MSTLADPAVRELCCARLARIDPLVRPRWGRMTAPQMVCHLNDSFAVAAGAKYASPATGLVQRTVIKWIALHTPVPWARGLPTRPEVEAGRGGTPPTEWDRDCGDLRARIAEFAALQRFGEHPLFGKMSRTDWLIWGYRHVDHHFRQFGV